MNQTVAVNWGDRWQLYRRLRELDIDCQCRSHQPLIVKLNSPEQVYLFWMAARRIQSSPQQLTQWLERCWS